MGDYNSLLVDMIAEYMRMHGKGMVFSPEIERAIGRPLGRSMEQMPPQRQQVIDALKNINKQPQQGLPPASPYNPNPGFIRG